MLESSVKQTLTWAVREEHKYFPPKKKSLQSVQMFPHSYETDAIA